MSLAIGIDLGTTNTVVAAVVDGVAVTLEDDSGRRLLPSVVSFHPSSTVLVGEGARERRLIDPENTIFSVKPLLGRSWDSEEVQSAKMRFPFRLVQGAKNSTMVVARDVAYALPEISAFVLRRAKSIAEAALGQPVDRAVITVPANFNDLQRASTKIAGKLAGLEVMRILNEPTAAALAYGQSISKAEKIAVYDLGGGTFDVTLLDLTGNVFEVLATAGDTALGGDDIDRLLSDRIAHDIIKRFNVDPRTNLASAARLAFMAEEIKKELSSAYQAKREITDIGQAPGGHPISMPFVMGREELEHLVQPLIVRTIEVAKQSIEIVGLTARDFDRVILVGGSTRMPIVARLVEHLFGQPPHLKVNPDEVVALGAAIQAHALNRSKGAHKRRSAHDQLAHTQQTASGEQVATRPPDADPTVAAPQVPKAPPLPSNIGVSPGRGAPAAPPRQAPAAAAPSRPTPVAAPSRPTPAAAAAAPPGVASPASPRQQTSAGFPEFLSFNKAAAVISFSDVPAAPPANVAPPSGGARPAAGPPPRPRMATLPFGPSGPELSEPGSSLPVQSRGQTDHASSPSRPSSRPIDGSPVRGGSAPEVFAGPKPARRSSAPAPLAAPIAPSASPASIFPAIPDLGPGLSDIVPELPLPSSGPPAAARGGPASSGLANLFSGTEPFPSFDLGASAMADVAADRFQQGSAVATSASTPLLIDVTPLSLGVETAGGYADVLIPANSPVPCEKTRTFLTASDGQSTVSIRVAQGESTRFAANVRLGDLELSGLRRAGRGEVKIAVTFELDADGILNVRARDQDTGRETVAVMRVAGASTDADELGAMQQRQARHHVV